MALEKLTENVEVIQTLGVYPNQENGLSGPELQQKFDEGNRILKEFLNEQVVPAHNQLLQAVGDNKVEADGQFKKYSQQYSAFAQVLVDHETRLGVQEQSEEAQQTQLELRSQGRSAKYEFATRGWKRVLNIIRGSGGMLTFCFGQSSPLYMAQVAGVVFSGFVQYGGDTSTDAKPVIYQMYNNIFGEDDALENPGSITKVRIGYPDPTQEDYDNGTSSGIINPINCYLDVFVDFNKDALNSGSVGFQMNYSGFADSHNCETITEETDAVDVGIYGEKLLYHELALDENGGIYMPEWGIRAAEVSADSMSVGGKKVLNTDDLNSVKKDITLGKTQVQFAFKSNNVSTPLLFAGISSAESTAYLKDTDTKTPFLDANGDPIDKKEAGAYVMAGVYGDIKTGTLHAKNFDAETDIKIKGKPVIDDTEVGGSTWSSKNTVDQLCPAFTESGSVAVCEPVEGYPLGVVTRIAPVQAGSGDPSPDNIRPITGHITPNLYHGGKNLIPKTEPTTVTNYGTTFVLENDGSVMVSGTPTSSAAIKLAAFSVGHLRGKQVTVNHNVGESVYLMANLYYNDGTTTSWNWLRGNRADSLTKVVPDNAETMELQVVALTTFDGNPVTFYPQLEFGAVSTDYAPPRESNRFTIDLGQTVYGGSLDWETGVLTIDRELRSFDGTEADINYNARGYNNGAYSIAGVITTKEQTTRILGDIVCSHLPTLPAIITSQEGVACRTGSDGVLLNFDTGIDLSDYTSAQCVALVRELMAEQYAAGTPVQIVYKLAEPITIRLTPRQIPALPGVNTLCSDCGNTEVSGRTDPVAIIQKQEQRLAALEAAIISNT